MEIPRKPARHTETLKTLKWMIKEMEDAGDKLTAECMVILISALEVGANVDRLVEHTGYPHEFIEAISPRMRNAGLWTGEWVDDMGWWDEEGNLTSEFFVQSQVASGRYLREWTEDGRSRYLAAATGKVLGDWSPLDHNAEVRRAIRTLLN